jgi:hypothetical protein
MAGLAALCTHMYLNRDISHMDGFAGGNEIRVSKSNMHMHMPLGISYGQPAAGSADGGHKGWAAPPLMHSATNLVVSADGPL